MTLVILIKMNLFLLVNDNNNGIIGFSTKSYLEVLCDISTIFIDGTFRSCPKIVINLSPFAPLSENHIFRLYFIFFVLPNKETKTYVRLFELPVNNCAQYQLILSFDVSSVYRFCDCFLRGCKDFLD